MTTFIRSRQSVNIKWLIILPVLIIAILSVADVWLYSNIVNWQHFISSRRQFIEQIKSENLNLQDQIYQITDTKKLINTAEKRGLILIKNPQFLQL